MSDAEPLPPVAEPGSPDGGAAPLGALLRRAGSRPSRSKARGGTILSRIVRLRLDYDGAAGRKRPPTA